MLFPDFRARRMRETKAFRRMIRETKLSCDDLILPLFVVKGENIKKPIESMPGHFHFSCDNLVKIVKQADSLNIPAVMLFGISDKKDSLATSAYDPNGIIQNAIKAIKDKVPNIAVLTDVCLCQYTINGHCGIVYNGKIDNDTSIELISKIALSYAKAGADMVAPSDMMDGRVGEIREVLDKDGFFNVPIMSYSAKYCSAFYGPFREAANSAPKFGDRKTYQMDPANQLEAVREATLDIAEGADIIMVKPALSYLDVIYRLKNEIDLPIAAYNVSGEYAMIKAGELMGWIDAKKVIMETLLSIKRAGADMILTYSAMEAAKELENR